MYELASQEERNYNAKTRRDEVEREGERTRSLGGGGGGERAYRGGGGGGGGGRDRKSGLAARARPKKRRARPSRRCGRSAGVFGAGGEGGWKRSGRQVVPSRGKGDFPSQKQSKAKK